VDRRYYIVTVSVDDVSGARCRRGAGQQRDIDTVVCSTAHAQFTLRRW